MDSLPASISGNASEHYVNATLDKPEQRASSRDPSLQPTDQHQQSQPEGGAPASIAMGTAVEIDTPRDRQQSAITFADLPPEIRELIWGYAMPDSRVFNALVYASVGLKMQLLERESLRLPLAHVCFESREAVRRAGYRLAFRDEDEPGDPGVWFHPRKDVIERTIWGPGDFWGLR